MDIARLEGRIIIISAHVANKCAAKQWQYAPQETLCRPWLSTHSRLEVEATFGIMSEIYLSQLLRLAMIIDIFSIFVIHCLYLPLATASTLPTDSTGNLPLNLAPHTK